MENNFRSSTFLNIKNSEDYRHALDEREKLTRDIDDKIYRLWEERQNLPSLPFVDYPEPKNLMDYENMFQVGYNCDHHYQFGDWIDYGNGVEEMTQTSTYFHACKNGRDEKCDPRDINTDDRVVIRIQPIVVPFQKQPLDINNSFQPITEPEFKNQIDIETRMGDLNIGPKVLDSWICKGDNAVYLHSNLINYGRLGYTVFDNLYDRGEPIRVFLSDHFDQDDYEEIESGIYQQLLEKLRLMAMNGIQNNDLLGNTIFIVSHNHDHEPFITNFETITEIDKTNPLEVDQAFEKMKNQVQVLFNTS